MFENQILCDCCFVVEIIDLICVYGIYLPEVDTSSVGTSLVVLDSESPTFKPNSSTPDCSFSRNIKKVALGVLL